MTEKGWYRRRLEFICGYKRWGAFQALWKYVEEYGSDAFVEVT